MKIKKLTNHLLNPCWCVYDEKGIQRGGIFIHQEHAEVFANQWVIDRNKKDVEVTYRINSGNGTWEVWNNKGHRIAKGFDTVSAAEKFVAEKVNGEWKQKKEPLGEIDLKEALQ